MIRFIISSAVRSTSTSSKASDVWEDHVEFALCDDGAAPDVQADEEALDILAGGPALPAFAAAAPLAF